MTKRQGQTRYLIYMHTLNITVTINGGHVSTIYALEYLYQLNFSWTEIADLVGVSHMTIYRHRIEFGMLDDNTLSRHDITDLELNEVLQQLRHNNPYSGESMMMGHLRALGISVSRERVRSILRRTDPSHKLLTNLFLCES